MTVNIEQSQDNNKDLLLPESLLARILQRLEIERQALSLRQRFIIVLVIFLGMLIAFIPVWNEFRSEFLRSGFGQYFALLFSDFRTVLDYWQDYGMSLIESFPIVSAVELLAILFTVLLTLKYLVKCSRGFFISYFLEPPRNKTLN